MWGINGEALWQQAVDGTFKMEPDAAKKWPKCL